MDEKSMELLTKYITKELDVVFKKQFNELNIVHNHPPLKFLVKNCDFCEKYGNIFVEKT